MFSCIFVAAMVRVACLTSCTRRRFASRRRSSCARSSGVNSAPKSSASKIGRISISDSPFSNGFGQRLIHSIDFVERFALEQPEAGDQFLRLGERTVDDGALGAVETHARAFRARLQAFAGEHHAGLDELFVELAHVADEAFRSASRRLRNLGLALTMTMKRMSVLLWVDFGRVLGVGSYWYVEWGRAKSTWGGKIFFRLRSAGREGSL